MISHFPFIAVVILIGLGVYALMFKRNLIKIVIGVTLIESGVNLFLITLGYVKGGVAPIYTNAPGTNMVMPTPQALTLTSIVIGLATTALMLSFVVLIYRHYNSIDAKNVRRLKG
ncbi:MAG: cation:proton antiporter subunit C [Candidatus Thermoplasmatota archaeon]|nr:cation:proton antiporter subunit C [Candidatus Thermoplasmatota archaeon]